MSVFRVDDESFSERFFNELMKTDNLFFDRNLILGKRLFTNSLISDYLLNNLENLELSKNIFILWEEEINTKYLNSIKKCSQKIYKFNSSFSRLDKKDSRNPNLFRITDAFAARKKENTWVLYQQELFKGTPIEDIFWTIVWQVKSLMAVKTGEGKDLHPFVYKKVQKAVSLFKKGELGGYFAELIDLYHKNRRGVGDLSIGLEKLILRI